MWMAHNYGGYETIKRHCFNINRVKTVFATNMGFALSFKQTPLLVQAPPAEHPLLAKPLVKKRKKLGNIKNWSVLSQIAFENPWKILKKH